MGFLKKSTGVAFSGFEGQLLYQGEPAAGARITRTYDLFGEIGEETIVADADGKFRFETIRVKFRTPLLAPFDFQCHQQILVDYNKENKQIWGASKESQEENSEFGGVPKNFHCELTDQNVRRVDLDHGVVGTICHWEL